MSGATLAIRLRALGDVVLTTPALRALLRGHPQAPLDVVTEERYAPLLRGLPGVERVLGVEPGAGVAATWRLARELRRRRYARVVDFFGNPRSATLTAACGARDTFGYDVRGRRNAYRTRVPRDLPGPAARREYAAASHVRLARAAGGVDDGLGARVMVSEAAAREAERILGATGLRAPERALGLVAAGTWSTKTWPLSHACAFARRMTERGWEMVALTGPGEEPVRAALRRHAPAVRALPECDVPVLAAVVRRLGGVVGTDSGPRHLAAAFGRPTFAWFGPTHPEAWTPPSGPHAVWWTELPCRGCNRTVCPHWSCLPALTPELAAERAHAHFERSLQLCGPADAA